VKQWMIWAGVGVLGILLAIIAIPWAIVPIDSGDPTLTLPPPREAPAPAPAPAPDPEPVEAPVVEETPPPTPARDTPAPEPVETPSEDEPDDGEPFVNPARQALKDRLSRPDVQFASSSASRWQALVHEIDQLDHDPAGDHVVRRAREVMGDLRFYQQDPDPREMEQLIARQRVIMGELKQTSYWGPEFQDYEARMENEIAEYFAGGSD
jgi:hypothetical protein